VHKVSVVLAVEMQLCLEWNVFKVAVEDIIDIRISLIQCCPQAIGQGIIDFFYVH